MRLHRLRHLETRLRELALPSPRRLLRWGKVLHAVGLRQAGVGTIGPMAYHVGYEDPASLCRLFRDLMGCSPTRSPLTVTMQQLQRRILHQLAR